MTNAQIWLDIAHKTLEIELTGIQSLSNRLDKSFVSACKLIEDCTGRVVVCGVGKSGHIANKIAATLASTGTVAFALHPTEAAHGDLGMIKSEDLVIAISYSGFSHELIDLLPALKRKKLTIIAMTADADSPLAHSANIIINTKVEREACPHNLAPTTSTTATLVLGDMLAMALMVGKGFSRDDFAKSHPAGRIGRLLTLQVRDIMHKPPDIPLVQTGQALSECLLVMTKHRLGMLGVINNYGQLIGIFTDGDLRRSIENRSNWHTVAIDKLMTSAPIKVDEQQLASEVLGWFKEKKINGAFTTDDNNQPTGAFNVHDLLQHGLV